jgi:hypothetical protein
MTSLMWSILCIILLVLSYIYISFDVKAYFTNLSYWYTVYAVIWSLTIYYKWVCANSNKDNELLLRRSFILETQFYISWYYFVNFVYKCLSLQFISWTMYLRKCFSFSIFPDIQTTKSFWCRNIFMPSSIYKIKIAIFVNLLN